MHRCDDASLCLETLRRVVSHLSAPVATKLDYAPFALSPSESASLAVLALEGIDAITLRLRNRGALSEETVQRLTGAIAEALAELTEEASRPVDFQRPPSLSGS